MLQQVFQTETNFQTLQHFSRHAYQNYLWCLDTWPYEHLHGMTTIHQRHFFLRVTLLSKYSRLFVVTFWFFLIIKLGFHLNRLSCWQTRALTLLSESNRKARSVDVYWVIPAGRADGIAFPAESTVKITPIYKQSYQWVRMPKKWDIRKI